MLKRFFDFVLAFAGLIIFLPLLVLIALLIKLNSSGPVFFGGVRIGRYGRPFRIYKFRSMVVNAEKLGGPSTPADDPRLTKIGKFLKKYQLDELPQLLNVFMGDMSLVGPRPEVLLYTDMMSKAERETILSMRPGMTDLASLRFFHEGDVLKGSPDPEKTYREKIRPKKLRLQMEYVKNRSFFMDLKIILKTILKMFS